MSIYTDMYKPKKRPVDPNAPPRPNLMSHDKVIRDQKVVIDNQQNTILQLMSRVEELERKQVRQTAYLNELHNNFSKILRKINLD